jgi:hypothetical protein
MIRASILASAALALVACKTPCKSGTLDAAWKTDALAPLILPGATVCEGSSPTKAVLWQGTKVHDANMASVAAAEDHGWDRNSDNWYSSKDFSDAPKWSELSNATGKLRIDVKEEGGGATITYSLTKK